MDLEIHIHLHRGWLDKPYLLDLIPKMSVGNVLIIGLSDNNKMHGFKLISK